MPQKVDEELCVKEWRTESEKGQTQKAGLMDRAREIRDLEGEALGSLQTIEMARSIEKNISQYS